MTTVLLCCAGASTRFPNYRAKWSLTHPDGDMMAAMAMKGLKGAGRVVAGFNTADIARYGAAAIKQEFWLAGQQVEVFDVGESPNQVATVWRLLGLAGVDGPFVVRDCDNYFELKVGTCNAVAVVNLESLTVPVVAGNKSYVVLGENGWVDGVVEKRVVSCWFCCGAYSFESPSVFVPYAAQSEYVSHVISKAIEAGERFEVQPATHYVDWGTEQDWQAYTRQYSTLFVDIDGVLVQPSHRTFSPAWGESEAIAANVEALNQLYATGKVEIILTTSRAEQWRRLTQAQLARAGVQYHRLIMDLRTCKRVLVNDHVPARAEVTAQAVNLERGSPLLGCYLDALG